MSRNIPFRQISSFAGQDPQLALFEQAVATKLLADDAVEYGPFKISQLQKATCNARAWDIILCDPTQASFAVILPDPRGALIANSWIAVKNDSGSANSITVKPAAGTIDGAASFVMNVARAFQWFYSTGVEWKAGPAYPPGGTVTDITIGPFALAADQTAYSPAGWSSARYVLLNPSIQTLFINSFDANVTVKRKTLINVATTDSDIRIRNNSFIDAVAANRVQLRKGNNVYLIALDAVDIWYDNVSACWRPV